jgi:EAL domain-containing protein (putative c-di-GMP-specific phosphodiesterase class I)/putative methionine-R-sulfoxide reductase with GAF domain
LANKSALTRVDIRSVTVCSDAERRLLEAGTSHAGERVRIHPNEKDRLDSLYSYDILDTEPEPAFDALTRLAARVCRTPMAGVSLVDRDRQWFKSFVGGEPMNIAREHSLCADAVADGEMLVVPDTLGHPRYAANPQVTSSPHIRGYAGAPLMGRDGLPIGALCVADRKPRRFTPAQLETLSDLAAQVVTVLEERRRDQVAGILEADVVADARDPVRLRQALEHGELIPYFQPIVDVTTGRPDALEALIRWEHPAFGTLSPAAFLPAIEGSALVVPVGRHVLDASLHTLRNLQQRRLLLPGGVAVNVSSGQLARPGLAADVFGALDRHRLTPQDLALEITETTAFRDKGVALNELTALADAGVRVVLDDFGVGWSNISRLIQLPVAALKLDRSLVTGMTGDDRAAFVVQATVAAALELNLDVIAEGVEDEQVRRRIAATGCRWAQGWLFSPALPEQSLPRLLRRSWLT